VWIPFLLLGFAAYGATPGEGPTTEADPVLKSRVEEYWAAVKGTDWVQAYRMESKAQGVNDPLDLIQYYNTKMEIPRHLDVKIEAIQQDGDSALVKERSLTVKSVEGASVPKVIFTESQWVRKDGIWLHEYSKRYTPEDVIKRRKEAELQAEKARQEREVAREGGTAHASGSNASELGASRQTSSSIPDIQKDVQSNQD